MFRGNFFYIFKWMLFYGEEVCRCFKKDDVYVFVSWLVSWFVERIIWCMIMFVVFGVGNVICIVIYGYMYSKVWL